MDGLLAWQRFFLVDPVAATALVPGRHDPTLVALSVLVAVLTSYMALQLAVKARQSPTRWLRAGALGAGALTLGAGVWSMHFIGVLAFQLCTTVRYDHWVTGLSVIPAMGAAWVALMVLAARQPSRLQLLGGGALMGAGIGLMHYSGMAAMQMGAVLRYDPLGFLASLVVAVALAVLALWIRAALAWRPWLSERWADLMAAGVMGAAISGMHYTAMGAARFVGVADADPMATLTQHLDLAVAVALTTVAVSALSASATAFLRYRIVFRELARSEARLQALFDTAIDGVLRLDTEGRIQTANAAALWLFGATEAQLIGQRLSERVPSLAAGPELPEGVTEALGCTVDGRKLPVRVAIGRSNVAGESLRVAFVADMSERRRIEQALARSEQQHRSLIANLPGAAVHALYDFATGHSELQFVSDAIEGLSGWSAAELMAGAEGLDGLIHPDDRARASHAGGKERVQAGPYHLEYRILRRDGQVRWVAETGTVAPQGAGLPARVDALVLDVTEARLRNAEFTGVLAAIRRALVLIEFDLEGHITHVNDNFLLLFGYRAEELVGRHHRVLCLPDESAGADYQAHWAALRRGEFRSGEFERVGRHGQHIWIQATYNPILDASGQPQRIVKFVTDLTDRHWLEQDLRDAKTRAEQAAAAKSTFLANMSHEIRTPMNAIIGFTEVVLDGELPAPARQHMQTVQRSARALLGLLNDILDTAKLESGTVELERRPLALRRLCEDVMATLEIAARRKGLALQLDIDVDVPALIEGDPLRLRQVLLNLAGNAVKFTEQGSVTLSARRGPAQTLELAVADTGIGIAPDRLERIFDPFAQADATMTRRFGGTGLGTTIARQLVQLMGGHIGVDSRPGEGSRFWVQLPLVLAQAEVSGFGALVAELPAEVPPLRLLIADDVPENLHLLALRLGQQGHQVVTASQGQEALEAMQRGAVDLALLDVQMPVMDGLQACRALREWEHSTGRARLPVIALTASAMQGDREQCLAAGMDGFAIKPIDWPALRAEMLRVLGLRAPDGLPHSAVAAQPAAAAALPAEVDRAAGLARWGDAELLGSQLKRFVDDTLSRWPHGHEDAAWAHRLRGALANFGLQAMADAIGELERGEVPAAADRWAAQRARLLALQSQMEVGSNGGEGMATPTRSWSRQDAEALDLALARGELPDRLSEQVLQSLPADERERLNEALQSFEFDQARHALARLMKELG